MKVVRIASEVLRSKRAQDEVESFILKLSESERRDLGWATDRGYWSGLAFDSMYMGEDENVWHIPVAAAWDILRLREEDPDAYLSSLGGRLVKKLIDLEMEIVR